MTLIKYREFIESCIANNNYDGICSLEDYRKMEIGLKEDGIL
jgi:hypothetical protein